MKKKIWSYLDVIPQPKSSIEIDGCEIDYMSLPNYGIYEITLSDKIIEYLWYIGEKSKSDDKDFKNTLAGNISKSYRMNDEGNYFWDEVLSHLIEEYFQLNVSSGSELVLGKGLVPGVLRPYKLALTDFWINYQYKHEFNPMHYHGGIYSFVIWMKIPYNYEDQCKLPQFNRMKGRNKKPGMFEFEYTNIFGDRSVIPYRLNDEYEGKMLFFPAKLAHQVFPFYETDEERVSISGNITHVPA